MPVAAELGEGPGLVPLGAGHGLLQAHGKILLIHLAGLQLDSYPLASN